VAACGIAPVTTCTDLLRPGGYGRLARYLDNLEAEMNEVGARTLAELAEQRGGARQALAEYARRVLQDPRYAAARNSTTPRRIGKTLALFDCINCDKCIPVCPNDANFSLEAPVLGPVDTVDLVVGAGGVVAREPAAPFALADHHQLANYADACNDCGNCDVFCPESGGPYKVKPRFFGGERTYRAAATLDGFVILGRGLMIGRIDGVEHRFELVGDVVVFSDGVVTAHLDAVNGALQEAGPAAGAAAPVGHRLPLWRYHAMRALYEGVMAGTNPVSARYLTL
jgi:putative selenate reductase